MEEKETKELEEKYAILTDLVELTKRIQALKNKDEAIEELLVALYNFEEANMAESIY